MKTEDFQSTKLWKQTIRKLRLIAALTNDSMVEVADRLATAELKRVQQHDPSPQGTPESNA